MTAPQKNKVIDTIKIAAFPMLVGIVVYYMQKHDDRLDKVADKIEALQGQFNDHKGRIETKVDNHDAEIKELKDEITELTRFQEMPRSNTYTFQQPIK